MCVCLLLQDLCVFITVVPITKFLQYRGVCLLLQDLVQSCLRGGGGIWEGMYYERRRAEACVD
jgi:hypothetical protein